MEFYTSDHHFDHRNVITYCNRPFSSMEEMNEVMVERWNEKVQKADTVWYLGDFSLGTKSLRFVERLNGIINFIPGNHDACWPGRRKAAKEKQRYLDAGFAQVITAPIMHKVAGEVNAWLWHLPYLQTPVPIGYDVRYPEWRIEDKGSFLVHGHVHGHWLKRGRMVNVGVDRHNFEPVPESRVLELLNTDVNL